MRLIEIEITDTYGDTTVAYVLRDMAKVYVQHNQGAAEGEIIRSDMAYSPEQAEELARSLLEMAASARKVEEVK